MTMATNFLHLPTTATNQVLGNVFMDVVVVARMESVHAPDMMNKMQFRQCLQGSVDADKIRTSSRYNDLFINLLTSQSFF